MIGKAFVAHVNARSSNHDPNHVLNHVPKRLSERDSSHVNTYTQCLLGSLFLALRTTLALMRSCVRSQELCARTMTMEDAYQVKISLQSRAPNVDSNSLTYF